MDSNLSDTTAVMVDGDPSSITLTDGTKVKISVCNGRTLPHLLRFVGRVAKDLDLKLSNAQGIETQLLQKLDDIGFLLQLIADYSEPLYDLLDRMTDIKGIDLVELLPTDDLIAVTVKVIEVNRTFFTERVLPVFLGAVEKNK